MPKARWSEWTVWSNTTSCPPQGSGNSSSVQLEVYPRNINYLFCDADNTFYWYHKRSACEWLGYGRAAFLHENSGASCIDRDAS